MHTVLSITGAVVGLVAFAGVARRYLVRPARRLLRAAAELAEQIRAAGASAQDLASLAGATTHFAVAFMDRLDELEKNLLAHEKRQAETAELVIDTAAEVHRLKKAG